MTGSGMADSRSRRAQEALQAACRGIAPAWPLDRQIAVSPYWGRTGQHFDDFAATLRRWVGAPMTLPRSEYLRLWQDGQIAPQHLEQAIRERHHRLSQQEALAALHQPTSAPAALPLLSDVLDADPEHGARSPWPNRLTQHLSQYCAAHFDQFQADGRPSERPGLFAGWRAQLQNGPHPPWLKQTEGVVPRVARLPASAAEALEWALERLAIGEAQFADLLQVVALRINGWASWCAYLSWEAALRARDDAELGELLTARLCWEALLDDGRRDAASPWSRWIEGWSAAQRADHAAAIEPELTWQRAHEIAYQQHLCTQLLSFTPVDADRKNNTRLQLVFCIDVRSERMRRAIEAIAADAHTYGFAGFFGLPIEYSPLGTALSHRQLPGLLTPTFHVTDTSGHAERDRQLISHRRHVLRSRDSTRLFERIPSGAFTRVEALGLAYLPRLLLRTFGYRSAPVQAIGLRARERRELRPHLCLTEADDLTALADRLANILRAMGLSEPCGRLLVLVGHGARVVNNPQAAALACGACGGHSGEINARLLAGLLNDAALRTALAQQGIHLHPSTVAVAALHDTVTDTVELLDVADVPPSHRADIEYLRDLLQRAGTQVRRERAGSLGLAHLEQRDAALLKQLQRRARDWAQTRPEWALADNAAFIIGARLRTRGLDLAGRAFLHEYCWQDDPGGTVLEQLLTAPMIVAHWINLQYYGSTVDPERYGSGNKILHNVVGGRIGVLEGAGGDLRIGLARQSVHDGECWRHTPLRLTVVVDAPRATLEGILTRQRRVAELIDHQWVYLFRFADRTLERYHAGLWQITPAPARSDTRPHLNSPETLGPRSAGHSCVPGLSALA